MQARAMLLAAFTMAGAVGPALGQPLDADYIQGDLLLRSDASVRGAKRPCGLLLHCTGDIDPSFTTLIDSDLDTMTGDVVEVEGVGRASLTDRYFELALWGFGDGATSRSHAGCMDLHDNIVFEVTGGTGTHYKLEFEAIYDGSLTTEHDIIVSFYAEFGVHQKPIPTDPVEYGDCDTPSTFHAVEWAGDFFDNEFSRSQPGALNISGSDGPELLDVRLAKGEPTSIGVDIRVAIDGHGDWTCSELDPARLRLKVYIIDNQ